MKRLVLISALLILGCTGEPHPNNPTFPRIIMDKDGNVYSTITVGDQIWLKENLVTTHFRNGDAVPSGMPAGYYAWTVANDSRAVCPAGYRLPTDADVNFMVNRLGGPNAYGAIFNEFRPAVLGYYDSIASQVLTVGYGYYWTSTESTATVAWGCKFSPAAAVVRSGYEKSNGLCIRCIKN